ncbi:Protein fam72a [Gryganskiella cystojenkinii]|nr:Protein fam72a [Gryganskiella cystojenkinii]
MSTERDRYFVSQGTSSASESVVNRGDIDHSHQGPSNYPDFSDQFSEFVRSNHLERRVNEQPHTIETYIDLEDSYQSILTAVSNIHMSQSRPSEDDLTSNHHMDSSGRVLSHSPYSMHVEELNGGDELEEIIIVEEGQGDEETPMAHGLDHGNTGLEEETRGDFDRSRSVDSESGLGDLYDMQHILVHNQRIRESQLHQSLVEYSQQSSRYRGSYPRSDNERILDTIGVPSSFESFHTNSSPFSSDEANPAAALDRYSPTHSLSGFLQQPSMSISSSYFTPTSESTIVLSSPPPGRTSGTFPYNSHSSVLPQSTQPVLGDGNALMTNNNTATLRHGGGPYRPFVTGRELAAQQQQMYQNLQSVSEQPPLDLRSTWPGAVNPWETEASDYSEDEFDEEGGQVEFGDSDTGHWSAYGSLTGSRSFEEHRHQHYHRQRQFQHRYRQSEQLLHQYQHPAHEGNPGGVAATASARPAAAVLGLGASPLLSRMHHESPRRGPHSMSSSFPGSGMTNIPIPSRYINPQPFNHAQYTSSTGSHLFRPHDISTGYNHQNGYRRPNPSYEVTATATARRRYVNGQPLPYSETIERAEAGGWTAPNLSSTSGSTSSSHWNDETHPGRSNIGMKEVIRMACRFCDTVICERGMKAQLLADHTIGLMSTDDEPHSVQLVGEEYRPTNCSCRIMDTACLVCAENNGHLWLFHPEYIASRIRRDPRCEKPLLWAELPPPEHDFETLSLVKVHIGSREGRLLIGGMVRREYDAVCR